MFCDLVALKPVPKVQVEKVSKNASSRGLRVQQKERNDTKSVQHPNMEA